MSRDFAVMKRAHRSGGPPPATTQSAERRRLWRGEHAGSLAPCRGTPPLPASRRIARSAEASFLVAREGAEEHRAFLERLSISARSARRDPGVPRNELGEESTGFSGVLSLSTVSGYRGHECPAQTQRWGGRGLAASGRQSPKDRRFGVQLVNTAEPLRTAPSAPIKV